MLTQGNELAHYLDSNLVSQVMRRQFWSLTEHMSVSQAISTMAGISALFAPVLNGDILIGIVTRSD